MWEPLLSACTLLPKQAIQQIAEEERARLFVPISIAQFSVYEALAAQRLAKSDDCSVCTLDAAAVALLNDKIKFTHFCERIGVAVPKCFAVTSRRELLDLNSRYHACWPAHTAPSLQGAQVPVPV